MPRLPLRILRTQHAPSVAAGFPVEAVRLVTHLSLATNVGWTKFRDVVVDTGAPISLLPSDLWKAARFRELGRTHVGGINSRAECRIPAILAEIECLLSDGTNSLGPLLIHCYLAESNQTPTLLGVSGFIARGVLHVEIENGVAWIEA